MSLDGVFPPLECHDIRSTLRHAFKRLTAIEEFISIRSNLYLDSGKIRLYKLGHDPPLPPLWPRLKRLALYNQDIDILELMSSMGKMQNLEVLVLTRPDGKQDALTSNLLTAKPLKRVLIVNTARWLYHRPIFTDYPEKLVEGSSHANELAIVARIYLTIDGKPFDQSTRLAEFLDYTPSMAEVRLCQGWTRDNAINGQLWDFA
ncbi:hypothetical protein EPUS_02800 [Endocarpon pusillum Z07020]|uniref:Uncharacterized protein n=1 Tax=Endocarpon pusillum (strain Z07020 / HMAS-L-300199) TaxID=1263415 RepID=U1HTD5_ENDPU|nr:uncharacterized protein EPUS_02800 [Endocarpon pusillum Z07020]ERF72519.1 hypothetical protein EPUS_02800 [Endocarpon pusillum Z07020]